MFMLSFPLLISVVLWHLFGAKLLLYIFWKTENIFIFLAFLNTEMAQADEIILCWMQGFVYLTNNHVINLVHLEYSNFNTRNVDLWWPNIYSLELKWSAHHWTRWYLVASPDLGVLRSIVPQKSKYEYYLSWKSCDKFSLSHGQISFWGLIVLTESKYLVFRPCQNQDQQSFSAGETIHMVDKNMTAEKCWYDLE